MFDDQPVHRAMERIFTPLATPHPAAPAPVAPRPHQPEAPARRRWFMGKDGIAAAGFAIAVTALGVVMVPLLSTSTPTTPPLSRAAAPSPPAPPAAAPVAAPASAPIAVPAPTLPQPAPIATTATPASPVVATPRHVARGTRPRIVQRHRARPRMARAYRRQEAPRLYGAALRRALARDVILTRRLNQQALRRMRAR